MSDQPVSAEYVLLPRAALFEFFGTVALPPWQDEQGRWIGGDIDCAPLAERITSWVKAHDLTGVVDPDQPFPAVAGWEPWPDNLPLAEQVERLAGVLLAHYQAAFDRSEGAMEKAARLLWEAAQSDGYPATD